LKIIVQTAADLDALQQADPHGYREQLTAILGSARIRTNQAEYPEDYDSTLTEGDEGYIAPLWVEVDDGATLARLGFESRTAVELRLSSLDG